MGDMPDLSPTRPAQRLDAGSTSDEVQVSVVREALLAVRIVDGGDFALMRTPGDDLALALGFLLAEGWIERASDVARLELCEGGDGVRVELARPPDRPAASRNLPLLSSCGLCGREDALPFLAGLAPVPAGEAFARAPLLEVSRRVRDRQSLFASTGGSHAAALFDRSGALLELAEDIGRHAAFDKAVGRALAAGRELGGLGGWISGRASLEMAAKAARARLPLLLSVGAPSDAAIDLANRLGMALGAFARGTDLTLFGNRPRVI